MINENITASIIIRSFNEERDIGRLLTGIFNQNVDFNFEVVLVDSGSTDATIDIASKYNIKIIHINPEDFSFGFALNKGIENASGKYCVMISAHCFPADNFWLKRIIAPFENQKYAVVYGKQLGDENTKYSEMQLLKRWFPDFDMEDEGVAFCNNANSAIRKELWQEHKFDEELTGLEDIEWTRFFLKRGYKAFYSYKAAIFHIHTESYKQIYNRYYRESLAYKQIFKNERFGLRYFFKFFIMNWGGDYIHAIRDKVFIKNILSIPSFRFMQFWGTYKGNNYKTQVSYSMQRRLYYPIKPNFLNTKRVTNKFKSEFIDITRKLSPTIPVWPGDCKFELTAFKTHDTHGVKVSSVNMNLHTGTHIDAPSHFIKGGSNVNDIPLEKLIGKVQVIEFKKDGPITVDFFKKIRWKLF